MSWYGTGYDTDLAKKDQAKQEAKYGPRRIWLKPDTSINAVFVDDEPFVFHEYQFRVGGDWKNWITDPGPDSPAFEYLRRELGDSTLVGMFTVVNCTPWEDKQKKVHQFQLELLPAKGRVMKKLKKKKEAKGSLTGKMCCITRTDDKAANTGDDFEFDREVDIAKMFETVNYKGKLLKDLYDEAEKDPEAMKRLKRTFTVRHEENDESKPLVREVPCFNYMELFKPLPTEEIKARVAGHDTPSDRKSGGGGSSKGNGARPEAGDDDVPF